MNREAWLQEAAGMLREGFTTRAGLVVPETVHISCGFPSTRATSNKNRRIGECWTTVPGTPVFISPVIADSLDVLQVLTHELIHAALPSGVGHKAPFKRAMRALDLGGKATATQRTPEFDAFAAPVVDALGDYPHVALDASKSGRKVQGTRMLKLECPVCGYIVRTTEKWIQTYDTLPTCPCGTEMESV